jgi:hypothetical protein
MVNRNNRAGVAAFIQSKCPRCGKGKVFSGSLFSLRSFSDTLECCPNCNLSYEPETGFFFGAMYFSYALIVGLIIIGSIVMNLLDLFDYAIFVIPVLLILLLPVIFRHSRLFMLYVVYPLMYEEKFFGKRKDSEENK